MTPETPDVKPIDEMGPYFQVMNRKERRRQAKQRRSASKRQAKKH